MIRTESNLKKKKCLGTWESKWKDVRMWESGTATRQGQWQWLKGIIGASAVMLCRGLRARWSKQAEESDQADCFLKQAQKAKADPSRRRFRPQGRRRPESRLHGALVHQGLNPSHLSYGQSLPFNEQLFTPWVLSLRVSEVGGLSKMSLN